ncbi:MAG: transposase [Rubrivivax sp.]|nr:transposase [Rubrivivax sp.]
MKRAGGGFDARYNAQTVVDEHAKIIVVAELGNNGADMRQLVPMIDAVKANTGKAPKRVLAGEGKAAYRKRKWIAEPSKGWTKSVLGFLQFSLRGLHRVQAEFKLVCLALNLRRMNSLKAATGALRGESHLHRRSAVTDGQDHRARRIPPPMPLGSAPGRVVPAATRIGTAGV